ncbi:MAG TPA: hypothetical protein VMY78_18135 [Solirubrobacteraceae bacterium]|nr:hypothetical protein [Solirubrobacteraceae bacterium]
MFRHQPSHDRRSATPPPPSDPRPELFDQAEYEDLEVLDAVPVLATLRPIELLRAPGALSPAVVQTAALVGASVVAGAATLAMAQRRRTRRIARRRRRVFGPVLASRSFLVDVHVLGERGK